MHHIVLRYTKKGIKKQPKKIEKLEQMLKALWKKEGIKCCYKEYEN